VIGSLATLAVVVIMARVGGRLLGVRLGWWRALAAGFPGLVIGFLIVWAATGRRQGRQYLPVPAVLLSALVATMLIAVLLELLARPGRLAVMAGRLRGSPLPHPVRAVRQRAARGRRYLVVSRIIARHGLSSYLGGRSPRDGQSRPLARNLRAALEEAGGMFIKLGQVLSTREDLLPHDVVTELSGLQDHVAPADPADVAVLLEAELGGPPADVFTSFDREPIAAASIAQAHRAQLLSGEQVVVKVQRPGVRALVERDLDILLRLARTLEARASWARNYGVVEMAGGFAAALREELDFRIEARNIAAVAGSRGIRIPVVYRSAPRVLVLEWLDGQSVRDADALLRDADRPALARGLLGTMLRQVMIDGTFHADPHPGNVLVLRAGGLALIDFGSVGRLDPLQQAALRRLMVALARRDPADLHDALADLAQIRKPAGDDLLERALAQFIAQHLGPGMAPDASMFTTLFRLLADFGLVFPPVIGGVFRAMVTLEGTLTRLSPGFEILPEAQSLASAWPGQMITPASLREAAAEEALGLLPVLRRLPRRFDRITTSVEQGLLTANIRLLADERDRRFIRAMVSRGVLALLGAALGIMSVMLIGVRGGPMLVQGTTLLRVLGYVGLFFSLVLILRVVIAITREGLLPRISAGRRAARGRPRGNGPRRRAWPGRGRWARRPAVPPTRPGWPARSASGG
jgi:ubiquinone biosynthesis protein